MVNITLIGMPRSGKSTLGKIISDTNHFNYPFIDVDKIIESSGRTLAQIITEEGEESLLRIEESALLSLYGSKMIISPGGSCIYSKKAMEYLKQISTVVYLDLPFEVIEKRIKKSGTENIVGLNGKNISELYIKRLPLYEMYADLTVHLGNKTEDENALTLFLNIYSYERKKFH